MAALEISSRKSHGKQQNQIKTTAREHYFNITCATVKPDKWARNITSIIDEIIEK